MSQIPKSLQGVLWSRKIENLDLQKDTPYIVNQVLSFGTLEEIRWLFDTYGKQTVRKVFLEKPVKVYTPSAFNFAKMILNLSDQEALAYRYDKNLPRHLG